MNEEHKITDWNEGLIEWATAFTNDILTTEFDTDETRNT